MGDMVAVNRRGKRWRRGPTKTQRLGSFMEGFSNMFLPAWQYSQDQSRRDQEFDRQGRRDAMYDARLLAGNVRDQFMTEEEMQKEIAALSKLHPDIPLDEVSSMVEPSLRSEEERIGQLRQNLGQTFPFMEQESFRPHLPGVGLSPESLDATKTPPTLPSTEMRGVLRYPGSGDSSQPMMRALERIDRPSETEIPSEMWETIQALQAADKAASDAKSLYEAEQLAEQQSRLTERQLSDEEDRLDREIAMARKSFRAMDDLEIERKKKELEATHEVASRYEMHNRPLEERRSYYAHEEELAMTRSAATQQPQVFDRLQPDGSVRSTMVKRLPNGEFAFLDISSMLDGVPYSAFAESGLYERANDTLIMGALTQVMREREGAGKPTDMSDPDTLSEVTSELGQAGWNPADVDSAINGIGTAMNAPSPFWDIPHGDGDRVVDSPMSAVELFIPTQPVDVSPDGEPLYEAGPGSARRFTEPKFAISQVTKMSNELKEIESKFQNAQNVIQEFKRKNPGWGDDRLPDVIQDEFEATSKVREDSIETLRQAVQYWKDKGYDYTHFLPGGGFNTRRQ